VALWSLGVDVIEERRSHPGVVNQSAMLARSEAHWTNDGFTQA
jgi:hypothetical protein